MFGGLEKIPAATGRRKGLKVNLILLGPPGAGKGTVAGSIKTAYEDILHLSTGDLLRAEIKKGTELGMKAKSIIDKGELVPDEVIIGMVAKILDEHKGGVMFDGFPRTVAQAEALSDIANIDIAVVLEADEDVVTQRMCTRRVCKDCGAVYNITLTKSTVCDACGGELITRPDDNEETARERFGVYMKNTSPLVEYYQNKGILFRVDANRHFSEVAKDVLEALSKIK